MSGIAAVCPCGERAPHVVSRRPTADGKHVLLWDDGKLTWALGYAIKGAPRGGSDFAKRVGRLVIGEVCLYDACEVSRLVQAARWSAQRDGMPGTMRRRYRDLAAPTTSLVPCWEVYSTDRDGRPTVRVWQLPRLLYPDLVVWHERGLYQICRRVDAADSTYAPTGFRARTLRELLGLIPELRVVEVMS